MDSKVRRSRSPITYSFCYKRLGQVRHLSFSPVRPLCRSTYLALPLHQLLTPVNAKIVRRIPSPPSSIIPKDFFISHRDQSANREEQPQTPKSDRYQKLLNRCEELFKVNQELADKFESNCYEQEPSERENLFEMRRKYQHLGSLHVDRLKQITLEKDALKTQLQIHQEFVKQLQSSLKDRDKQIQELKIAEKSLKDLNDRIKKKNQKILQAFSEGIKQKDHITQLEKKLSDLQSSMEMSLRQSQSQASQLDIVPFELKSKISDLELQLRRKNQELELEQIKVQRLKEALNKYESDHGSQIESLKTENQQLKSKNLELQRQALDQDRQIQLITFDNNQQQERVKEQQAHSNHQIEQLLKLNDDYQMRITELETKLEQLRTRNRSAKDVITTAQKLALEKKIQELLEKIVELEQENNALSNKESVGARHIASSQDERAKFNTIESSDAQQDESVDNKKNSKSQTGSFKKLGF